VANGIYKLGMEAILNKLVDLDTDNIKVALIDTGTYTVNLTTHDFYNDLTGVVGTPVALAGKTISLGVFNATSPTSFSGTGGNSVEALVIYQDTGNVATSILLFYLDTVASGLPFTPPAGAWTLDITWDSGTNKIAKFG
jgi:hypothetical protein